MEFTDLTFGGHLLSLLVFFPLIWGLVGLVIPARDGSPATVLKAWTLIGTLITAALSLVLYKNYVPSGEEFQLTETMQWIPGLGTQFALGIDGISLWLILLTTFLAPLVVMCSFSAVETRERGYYFLLMMLMSGILGAFVSLDMFLFYVFWEVMLIPMYFLIGIWGGKERIYAANKFFLYTVVGSLLMLVAIFYLAVQHHVQFGTYSTLLADLVKVKIEGGPSYTSPQALLFLAFALAFAIKVPLFPLHTWLPDAHVQAPTAGSVILAGVLLKLGGYGMMRFAFPLFPEALMLFKMPIMILSSIAIVYGAWMALVQTDVKKLVAYSSVSHMGYVVLGLFALNVQGVTGAMYQMLNHGISTGGLFLLVGMIYERRHTREISEFGGIAKVMPLFSVALMIMTLSSVALPLTNGFVGEFLILLGSFRASPVLAAISATGVIFGAVYMLLVYQKVIFGELNNEENKKLTDLTFREKITMLPLVFAVFFMGLQPNFFIQSMQPSIDRLLAKVNAPVTMQAATDVPVTNNNALGLQAKQ